MSKESFKNFARNHTELANQIIEGKTSWQKLYELYEIYGEDSTIWNEYLNTKQTTISDFISTIKNIDMNSIQSGIKNIQKTINLLQEIGLGSNNTNTNYEPRPMYKYFED